MASALLLSAFLTLHAQSAPAPAFQPHFGVRFEPGAAHQIFARPTDAREVVCGMTVIHKTPADDPKILLPSRRTGAAVRRIESHGCGAKTVPPK